MSTKGIPTRPRAIATTENGALGQRLSRRLAVSSLGAAVVATPLGGQFRQTARAQEGTPSAQMPAEAIRGLVQFVHPEKVFFYLPGAEEEALIAAFYGLDPNGYRAITEEYAAAARGAAEELLADPALAEQVDRLPFAAGSTVIGVGESDMDDLQSWVEIVRHLLDLQRPQDEIVVINQGVSGRATSETLGSFAAILGQQPDWIICALGGNDAVRYGRQPTKTRVSIEETALNLAELRHQAAAQSAANWVWVTRWIADEARIAAYPPFQMAQFALRNADMAAVNDLVRDQAGIVVDLVPVIGEPPQPELLIEDGLHPSLAGHAAIAKALVERLVGST